MLATLLLKILEIVVVIFSISCLGVNEDKTTKTERFFPGLSILVDGRAMYLDWIFLQLQYEQQYYVFFELL